MGRDVGWWAAAAAIVALLHFVLPLLPLNAYHVQVLMYVGINVILAASLNLVNGYMGEFSVGHAGFMAVGAYVSAVTMLWAVPRAWWPYFFPVSVVLGGAGAAAVGLLVAIPSFRTRGDYLAIVTLALNMIVKSVIENIEAVGGPRGLVGIARLTSPAWVYLWVFVTLGALRQFLHSRFGRGVQAIREDEVAAEIIGIETRRVKLQAFLIAAFFAGVAGGLYAHLIQFINPKSFDIVKSTEILVMVYLGGVASLAGSVLGAAIYTVLLELLRFLGLWRWVLAPLLLVLLMILRPRGILGYQEPAVLIPWRERLLRRRAREGAKAVAAP
ncbi:MAG: branched-chain amino acid ABC transporter permease [Limnochordaceae bacterium]|nr:branched-chain amino acid ABC transporter permease [Limnochordaceae bacterium]